MEYFDKRMALDVIEDALTDIGTPRSHGVATGLCGAFYMCGLLSAEEWEAFLKRIPLETYKVRVGGIHEMQDPEATVRGRILN